MPGWRRSPGFDLGIDFEEGLPDFANKLITRVEGRIEIMMGAGQTRQGGNSQGEGAQIIHHVAIGLRLTQVLDALHGLADEIDLGLEGEVKRLCL